MILLEAYFKKWMVYLYIFSYTLYVYNMIIIINKHDYGEKILLKYKIDITQRINLRYIVSYKNQIFE